MFSICGKIYWVGLILLFSVRRLILHITFCFLKFGPFFEKLQIQIFKINFEPAMWIEPPETDWISSTSRAACCARLSGAEAAFLSACFSRQEPRDATASPVWANYAARDATASPHMQTTQRALRATRQRCPT
ncbi:MAG: hypothetical protein GY821_17260 [Gammaproteobacteria bacterium]|nr:hypothetical protein [Gammaproteobacteria bacterium]